MFRENTLIVSFPAMPLLYMYVDVRTLFAKLHEIFHFPIFIQAVRFNLV